MQSEYLRIRELFEGEKRIDRFLYLAANSHIHSLLKKCFWGTTRNVYIGFANDLSRHELGVDRGSVRADHETAPVRRHPLTIHCAYDALLLSFATAS